LVWILLFTRHERPHPRAVARTRRIEELTMTSKQTSGAANGAGGDADNTPTNAQKDPDQWVTGDESMTGAQQSYLKTLSEEAGEEMDENLTKAEASKKIDELRERTGRGIDH
jgi:hypothetical protein